MSGQFLNQLLQVLALMRSSLLTFRTWLWPVIRRSTRSYGKIQLIMATCR